MKFFKLNEQLCNKDGICARLCPSNIIKINPDTKYPYIDASDEAKCIKCGQCGSFCPTRACEVQSLAFENFDSASLPTSSAVDILMQSRRSVRMFRKDLIPQQELENLLTVASMAPSGINARSIRWLVISGRDKIVKIVDYIADFIETNSRLSDYFRKYIDEYRKGGSDPIMRGASQLVISLCPADWLLTEDGVIAMAYMELAAHSRNIGTCWAGLFMAAARSYAPLQEYLGLDGELVCAAQMIGYPTLKIKKMPKRMPLKMEFR